MHKLQVSSDSILAELFRMPERINASNLLVLRSRHLVWCPVFKAASTNWMKIVPTLSNYLPAQMQVRSRATFTFCDAK